VSISDLERFLTQVKSEFRGQMFRDMADLEVVEARELLLQGRLIPTVTRTMVTAAKFGEKDHTKYPRHEACERLYNLSSLYDQLRDNGLDCSDEGTSVEQITAHLNMFTDAPRVHAHTIAECLYIMYTPER
jgi:hypothetical protein